MLHPLPLLALFALTALATTGARASDPVTVYRCTGADGKVTLGDSKCPPGQRQEIREMLRPQDPPARAPAAAAEPEPPAPPPPPREVVVYRSPPQPMFECVKDDGQTYTSDNGDGNPRLVPLWALGPRGYGSVVVGNTWIRDTCHQLPQAEACARLRDRRYEILRQYHSALQSERKALDKEQRGVDARLGNDCGAG